MPISFSLFIIFYSLILCQISFLCTSFTLPFVSTSSKYMSRTHVTSTLISLGNSHLHASSPSSIPNDNTPLSSTRNTKRNKNINIPNALSLLRVLAIPLFCACFVSGRKGAGLAIYIASCITDFVDGYIARSLNQMTAFGAFIDPVADKLMVAAALILLVCQLPVWWFAMPVLIILSREIAVSALREWMAERGQRSTVKVGFLGKLKTALQMVSTSLLLAACPGAADFSLQTSLGVSRTSMLTAGLLTLYMSTVLAMVSAAQYFAAAWPTLIAGEESEDGASSVVKKF